MDDKDFLMVLRGALLVDLDEGASMYKSLAIKIKSMITLTHDEYRAPYARTIKKYPRRFVFSMSTNDDEPFRDTTGNRRYWTVDLGEDMINFKWLEEARDQLFAEAYHIYKNKLDLPDVPMDIAQAKQLDHLGEDPWTELVQKYLNKELDYVQGKAYFQTSIIDIYGTLFGEDKLDRLNRPTEMRMATILKHLGFYKKRVQYGGERKSCWRLGPKKIRELKEAYENSLDPNYKPEGEDAEDNPQPRKSIDDQFNEF
jgi:putative DNA primase/helicase